MDVIGGLPVDLLNGIGAGGLVVLVVMLIMLGRLYPRSWVQEVRVDRDAWRKAAETWKSVAETSEQARQVQGMQLDKLLEHAETQNRLGEAMAKALERIERERAGGQVQP